MKQLTEPFERTLDKDGRIVIPASLRKHYSGELIIMKGLEQRIWIMTRKTHGKFLQTINEVHKGDKGGRSTLLYSFLGTALATKPDKSGRIKLSPALISHAQLSKKCLIRSIDEQETEPEPEHLEIWNAEA